MRLSPLVPFEQRAMDPLEDRWKQLTLTKAEDREVVIDEAS